MIRDEDTLFLVFFLNKHPFALPVGTIDRVTAAVEVEPLPDAPGFLMGAVNCGGALLPVVDLRVRFGFPRTPLRSRHRFLLVTFQDRRMALLVEGIEGVVPLQEEPLGLSSWKNVPRAGVGTSPGGTHIICIQTLEALFAVTPEELRKLWECCEALEKEAL